jgi:hypothetical protein
VATVLTRRWRALLVVLALVAAGCGRSNDTQSGGTTLPTALPGQSPSTTTGGGPTETTPRSSAGGGTPHGASTTGKPSDPPRQAFDGGPGSFAGVLLAPGPATNIVIDLLVQSGTSADPDVISTLRDVLAASSGKPVTVRGPTTLNTSSNAYDADAIRHLADTQGKPQGENTAVIHLLYLKGSFSDDSVLGVTVRADTTAIFPDQIDSASSPFASTRRIEQAVDTHELGHVLGLVDLYLNDNRDDPQHPGHSTNPHSVMYWAVESDLVGQVLDGPPPVAFDGADQSDLQRIHAGAAPASQ